MGKHSARDGATVHPLVADALERRQQGSAPEVDAGRSSTVGWPGEPAGGEGLGWPGDGPVELRDRHPEDDGSVLAVLDEAAAQEPAGEESEPAVRRSGWRRFFGGGPSGPRGTTSAA